MLFFIIVLNKGQVMSNYYRIMNKQGGYSWMQSCATLICNTKNSDEQSIICVNYVLRYQLYINLDMYNILFSTIMIRIY